MGAVFTIPAHLPFLDTLVAGLRQRMGTEPLALARCTILLPTRRATRAAQEAFLRAQKGKATLLPRLLPVGDLDAEELTLLAEGGGDEGALDIPPTVPELRRRLALATLVLKWGKSRGALAAAQAVPLAADLGRFLDEVQSERCDFAGLSQLVPVDLAAHWQQVLRFLEIVTQHWPAALAEIGCLDPAERRNRLLAAQADAWRRSPPADPVIAAGITGEVPAVAELVAAVAGLDHGIIVLPGLDQSRDADGWQEIAADPGHPQHLLARLLERLALDPADVREWPAPQARGAPPARSRLVVEALRPAAESDRWRQLAGIDESALSGMRRLDCPGPQEEAQVIALLLRQALETPGKVAALVTPDRDLARRVAAELGRWGIDIDDSAGVPLNRSPPGVFLRLVVEAAAQELAPLPLLALLKHPLAAGGDAPEAFRALVRRLETAVLRGPRPAPGVAGLLAALGEGHGELRTLVTRIGRALAPLLAALDEKNVALRMLLEAHLAAAEALARSDAEAGAARLWREPAGEAAAQTASELLEAADAFPPVAGRDYPALFEVLLAGPVVRPPYGRHARLFIWGLLEARLQQADLLVLGGLNEGVWPPAAESDPWLSRPMRRAFGMAPPERRIGITAHDFAQALGAPEVVLTRALRVEGTPTVPSRWLLRLETVLRAAGLAGKLGTASEPLLWQALLDQPAETVPTRAPEPRPPVDARPRQLSVTAIETWMRDPYAIYARHVLRLRALDPLDDDPGAADRGQFIHDALDQFLRAFPEALPRDAAARLLEFGRLAFGTALERPGVRAFWWPRFERIAQWFVAAEADRRDRATAIHSERQGRIILDAPGGPFILTAKADRIDVLRAGGLALLDYKTGTLPQTAEIQLGYSSQLPLEAAIAERGGFAGLPAAPVTRLDFWRLTGSDPAGEARALAKTEPELRRLIENAFAGLEALVARFDDPDTPYRAVPRPERAPRYSDYGHLARIKAWSSTGEAEE